MDTIVEVIRKVTNYDVVECKELAMHMATINDGVSPYQITECDWLDGDDLLKLYNSVKHVFTNKSETDD